MLLVSVSGFPGGARLAFELRAPERHDELYRLMITDTDRVDPGRVAIDLTDAQRRDLIHVLGGIPVEPAAVHIEAANGSAPSKEMVS